MPASTMTVSSLAELARALGAPVPAALDALRPTTGDDAAAVTLVTGGTARDRARAVLALVAPSVTSGVRVERDAASWPWSGPGWPTIEGEAGMVVAIDVEAAFPAGQGCGTRAVLIDPIYLVQRWRDALGGRSPGRLVMTAARGALDRSAPEAMQRRGPWAESAHIDVGADDDAETGPVSDATPPSGVLESDDADTLQRWAFRATDASWRLAACRRLAALRPEDPAVHVALGSAAMEVQALDEADTASSRALAIAPAWEAAWFERGKYWLRRDDVAQAAAAFRKAGELMPSFAAAFSNLGAALGELDQGAAALAAFQQALRFDPRGHTILNNIGVVARETGRLADSEAALRRVTSLAPEFAFGHYNLGHTLFLQGRYQASLAAYVEGQRRDAEKNPRQACRLAMVRLATGDAAGARRDLDRATAAVPREARRDLLAEVHEILWALVSAHADLADVRDIAAWVKAGLA